MRLAAISMVVLLSLFLAAALAPPAAAQAYSIKPGGAYVIKVTVHKPAYIRLPEDGWQIRFYFHSGSTCYAAGADDPVYGYSGWWRYTAGGDEWSGAPEDKTYQTTVSLTEDMPSSGSAQLRARLVIKDINAQFSGPEEAEGGYVSFTIGGISYQYQYYREFEDYIISGENFNGKIVFKSYKNNYDLYVDRDLPGVSISSSASSTDIFIIPLPINVNLVSAARPEEPLELPLELKVAMGVVTVMIVAGAVAYLALRGRRTEEPPPI